MSPTAWFWSFLILHPKLTLFQVSGIYENISLLKSGIVRVAWKVPYLILDLLQRDPDISGQYRMGLLSCTFWDTFIE